MTLENTFLFRCGFLILLLGIPLIKYFIHLIDIQLSPLYFLAAILLGFGFWDKSKMFLICSSMVIAFCRLYFTEIYSFNILNFLILAIVYFFITLVSALLSKNHRNTNKKKLDVIISLAKTLDSKDPYTASHSDNVARYSVMIAKEMKISSAHCYDIYIGGLLHDIGKIGIPEQILVKTGRLTDEEYEIIKKHPRIGYKTMEHIDTFTENGVLDMVLYHHERYDGKGYPLGLKGEDIPFFARIISLADSFDAMTTRRSYRDKLDFDSVMNEISRNKGLQFDPLIADALLSVLQREGESILIKSEDKVAENDKSLITFERLQKPRTGFLL